MIRQTIAAGAAMLTASAALAMCETGTTVLACDLAGAPLKICISDEGATYHHGSATQPKLVMQQPLDALEATPWAGIGRTIYEDVTFQRGDLRYRVWTSLDRLENAGRMNGGVSVTRAEVPLAELTCRSGTAQVQVFAVSDAFERAGYCWDRELRKWVQPCR